MQTSCCGLHSKLKQPQWLCLEFLGLWNTSAWHLHAVPNTDNNTAHVGITMKSIASGDLGIKALKELVLDYNVRSKSDILTRLGSRSKYNRLIYMVGEEQR